MVSVAILSADERLSSQIQQWMREIEDQIAWTVHTSASAYVQRIETESASAVVAASKAGAGAVLDAEDIGARKSHELVDAFIRLVIVDLELLTSNGIEPIAWTRSLKKLMIERERTNAVSPTQFLFLAFEGGGFKIEQLLDPVIDDVMVKPLDRSVFLQKIEIMTTDDLTKLKPSYLFRQKTSMPIEIGKDILIEEISEFAIAIRNPVALAPGVFAAIYSPVFGEGAMARVLCRTYKSEPHRAHAGQQRVSFSFFGLRGQQLANIKKFMRENQPQKVRIPRPPVPNVDPVVPFNRIAIIDMNVEVFNEIETALKELYVGVQIDHYLSYASFLAKLKAFETAPLAPAPAGSEALIGEATEALAAIAAGPKPNLWTGPKSFALIVGARHSELLKFVTTLGPTDLVLGHEVASWGARGSGFLAAFEPAEAEEIRETIAYAVASGNGRVRLKLRDAANRSVQVEVVSSLAQAGDAETDAQVRLEFKEITGAVTDEAVRTASDFAYDAIYLDVNLIRGDLQHWYDELQQSFLRADVLQAGQSMPKITLIADERSRAIPENYRLKVVSDFLYKPLDRKIVSYKAKELIELVPRTEPEHPPTLKLEISAKLAKDVVMEDVSEYGISIVHPTPFRRGATVRIFSSLFGGGADGIVARCSYCEERKVEKTVSFVCHFMYFGTPDEILKRIRTWIRETYVHEKEGT